jgi:hypothetical protein
MGSSHTICERERYSFLEDCFPVCNSPDSYSEGKLASKRFDHSFKDDRATNLVVVTPRYVRTLQRS